MRDGALQVIVKVTLCLSHGCPCLPPASLLVKIACMGLQFGSSETPHLRQPSAHRGALALFGEVLCCDDIA